MKIDIKDCSEPTLCIVIRCDKDFPKAKSTTLCVYEAVVDAQSSKARSNHTMLVAEWSGEMIKETIDQGSSISARSKVLLLKSSLHDIGAMHAELSFPNHHLSINRVLCIIPASKFGEVSFHTGYWEWVEDVLGHYADTLCRSKIYAAVHASLFMHVCNKNVLQAFLELWCPYTNTLHIAIGELSISLWDLRGLCGLPTRGNFYDEVVPSAKELLDAGTCQSSLLRSCKYLFATYHILLKDSNGVSISDWIEFWFRGSTRYS